MIVDEDVGLLFWFGEIFATAGWNIVPALNCQQAVSLAAMWDLHIDLVVANPALRGVSEMVETLSRVHRPKVVVIHEPDMAAIPADATLDRPDIRTSKSRADSAKLVRKLLRNIGLGFETEPDGSRGV